MKYSRKPKQVSSTEEHSKSAKRGFYFASALFQSLTQGVKTYASETGARKDFLDENQYLFSGLMLVGMFAYLDSTLGKGWVDRHGGNHIRDLNCLRIVRNAYIHTNSNIEALESTNEDDINVVRLYIDDLSKGIVNDDKGNPFPQYLSISDDNVVVLNEKAFHILKVLITTISH